MGSLYIKREPKLKLKFYYQDQTILNYALDNMTINWDNSDTSRKESRGKAGKGLEVVALPQIQVCRKDFCEESNESDYYVWHKGGREESAKVERALKSGVWYLREDWEAVSEMSSEKGEQWLKTLIR